VSEVNVLTVTFEKNAQAHEAITKLNELDSQDQIKLRAAAVVTRDPSGRVQIQDKVGGPEYVGTATGGMLGLLIGIIGGPLGMLLGGATGVLIGGAFDLEEEEGEGSVLGEISTRVRPGSEVLMAELEEQSPEVVDDAMKRLSGNVLRRSRGSVEGEMAYAQAVHREIRSSARHKLHEERKKTDEQQVKEKMAELKAKFAHNGSHGNTDQGSESTAPATSQQDHAGVGAAA